MKQLIQSRFTIDHNRLLRPSEAFDVLGVGHTKGYRMVKSGVIPAVRVGTSIRIPAAALEQWIQRNTRQLPMAGAR